MPKELKASPCVLTAWAGSALFRLDVFALLVAGFLLLTEPCLELVAFHTEQGQDLTLCCFAGLGSGFLWRGEVVNNRTLRLSFAEGCCTVQLSIQGRKSGFGKSGKREQLSVVSGIWLVTLFGDAFPPSAHPLDSCPLLWLDGYLNTLNGEENIAAVSEGSEVELLVQYHTENFGLNGRKGGKTGTR